MGRGMEGWEEGDGKGEGESGRGIARLGKGEGGWTWKFVQGPRVTPVSLVDLPASLSVS